MCRAHARRNQDRHPRRYPETSRRGRGGIHQSTGQVISCNVCSSDGFQVASGVMFTRRSRVFPQNTFSGEGPPRPLGEEVSSFQFSGKTRDRSYKRSASSHHFDVGRSMLLPSRSGGLRSAMPMRSQWWRESLFIVPTWAGDAAISSPWEELPIPPEHSQNDVGVDADRH
jgi:hypothetical protein